MCRLLHGIIRAYQRLLRTLAELDAAAEPARQLGELNRLADLDLSH
ncbi:MAG: hypothetical protein ABI561_01670 [Bradyrhizobium sp.]